MAYPVELAVRYIRTTERLTLLINAATAMVDTMGEIHADDDALAPELHVALLELNDCVQALRRAHEFSKTRMEVAIDRAQS